MRLSAITVTGADDEVPVSQLQALSVKYPLVEWGILLSVEQGRPRFPSQEWIEELAAVGCRHRMRLSLHVCGHMVRQLCRGEWSALLDKTRTYRNAFGRVQLNLSPYVRLLSLQSYHRAEAFQLDYGKRLIFQLKAESAKTVKADLGLLGMDIDILYDASGGRGVLPDVWPVDESGLHVGYAGGLAADNVEAQLDKISFSVCHDAEVWIDTESGVRTDNHFDISLVDDFLAAATSTRYCDMSHA